VKGKKARRCICHGLSQLTLQKRRSIKCSWKTSSHNSLLKNIQMATGEKARRCIRCSCIASSRNTLQKNREIGRRRRQENDFGEAAMISLTTDIGKLRWQQDAVDVAGMPSHKMNHRQTGKGKKARRCSEL
jgi:hypothetical protein